MNKRSTALDALRGLAIIGMVLSGTIAQSLPAWMYHAQVGPRSGFQFDPTIYGITWVDLVFPFFLFAMGAAFPLALSSKLDKGANPNSLIQLILKRTFLLVVFAISIYHCSPFRLNGNWNYALALLAFSLFFISFVRIPAFSESRNKWLSRIGIVSLTASIALNVISQPNVFAQGFKLSHNDIIILILANMALFGSIIWIITRNNIIARIGIMAFLFAFKLTSEVEGSWNQLVWNFHPAMFLPENILSAIYLPHQWLFQMTFLKYLFIIIPGTIAGDLLVKWLSENDTDKYVRPARWKMWVVIFLLFVLVVSNLVCLYSRYLDLNIVLNILFGISIYYLLRNPTHSTSRLYYSLYQWGIVWLLLGNVFEAFEGGIRKDHATMSYFFVTCGLAIFTLIFFSIVIDYFENKKIFKIVSEVGQNPMLAYVAGTFFVVPVLVFIGLMPYINKIDEITPWLGLSKGLIITGGMIVVTVVSVRKNWFWKT